MSLANGIEKGMYIARHHVDVGDIRFPEGTVVEVNGLERNPITEKCVVTLICCIIKSIPMADGETFKMEAPAKIDGSYFAYFFLKQ